MTNEDMVELALRCEAAGGASYALDCEIWDAIYPGERDGRFRTLCDGGAYKGRLGPADKDGYIQPLRAFTASLDAAATLVPEGCLFTMRTLWDGPEAHGYAIVSTYCDDGEECDNKRHLDDYAGLAATPALALVSAALRAQVTRG